MDVEHHWTEDELEPRVGYMEVTDPAGLAAITDARSLRVIPEFKASLKLREGDLLYITIVGNRKLSSQRRA